MNCAFAGHRTAAAKNTSNANATQNEIQEKIGGASALSKGTRLSPPALPPGIFDTPALNVGLLLVLGFGFASAAFYGSRRSFDRTGGR